MTASLSGYQFGPYVLDPANALLCRSAQSVPLTPKAFAVLQHLVSRAGQLVTKQELFETVWAGTFVGDAALKVCVREIRKALADDAKMPTFVETIHRRGYRFVAAVSELPRAPEKWMEQPPTTAQVVHFPFSPPKTRYTRSGDVSIAYQVVGDGPLDLVLVMGWVSNLEYFWKEARFARFLRRLSSFTRLILFDKRGTGLSDRAVELPNLEQRMDDVRAVMDAVGSEQAALLGISEGGPMSSLFAASYPARTLALVMFGTYARRRWSPEYPWAPTAEEREGLFEEIRRHWGGPVGIEERAPSVAADPEFRAWWADYLRMGASPGAALALTRMNTDIDVREILPSIRVPTLVLHRTEDRCLKIDEGRYVASRIPGARFVELPGSDHLPFIGDQDALVGAIEEFLTGFRRGPELDRVLATVLYARVSDRSDTAHEGNRDERLERFHGCARREVSWLKGSRLHLGPDRVLAMFDGPARAIRCAFALRAAAERLGIELRAGLHTGECALLADGLAGPAVELSEQIAGTAAPSEVLTSPMVKGLVAGSDLCFEEQAALGHRTRTDIRPLYAVRDWPTSVNRGAGAAR